MNRTPSWLRLVSWVAIVMIAAQSISSFSPVASAQDKPLIPNFSSENGEYELTTQPHVELVKLELLLQNLVIERRAEELPTRYLLVPADLPSIKERWTAYDELIVKTVENFAYAVKWKGDLYKVPPALLKAVAVAESGLNPLAVSHYRALGIMQFIPGTAAAMGVPNALGDPTVRFDPKPPGGHQSAWRVKYATSGIWDPAVSFRAGMQYLTELRRAFSQEERGLWLAIGGYNCGQGNIERHGGRAGQRNIPSGPAFRETRVYAPKVLRLYQEFLYNRPLAGAPPPPPEGSPFWVPPPGH